MKKGSTGISILYLAPSFLIYSTFVIFAIGLAFYYTTLNWAGVGEKAFVGLKNYLSLLRNPEYIQVARNTGILLALALVIQLPLALVLAYMVYRVKVGYSILRALIFLPVVITPLTIGLMFQLLLNSDLDILNALLRLLGVGFLQQKWLTDPNVVLYSVAVPQLWQYLGFPFVILLTAIQGIPREIFESAQMDGASGLRVVWRIVLPLIRDILVVVTILDVTFLLKSFDIPWIMTTGGPGYASSYISILMYFEAFKGYNFSYGVTIGMTIFIFAFLITTLLRRFFRREPIEY
jgi:raffinose/stachyose/melibiose transport system permease protein